MCESRVDLQLIAYESAKIATTQSNWAVCASIYDLQHIGFDSNPLLAHWCATHSTLVCQCYSKVTSEA